MTTTDSTPLEKPERSAWVGRVLWALLGGLGAVAVGVSINLITAAFAGQEETVISAENSVTCEKEPALATVEGEELLEVRLLAPYRECWRQTIDTARPGDVFSMGISYQNNTSVQQDNVLIRADLPAGFEYVEGSATIANSTTAGESTETIDGIATTGLNAGSYRPRGNVFYTFEVRMTEDLAPLAGTQTWTLGATATTPHSPDGTKAYSAVVTVRPPG